MADHESTPSNPKTPLPGLWLLSLFSALTSLGIGLAACRQYGHVFYFEGEDGYRRLTQIILGLTLALLTLIFLSSAITFYLNLPSRQAR